MHVTCAAIAGVRMETEIEMRGGRKFNRKVYCLKHSRMDKHQITQGIKRVMEALVSQKLCGSLKFLYFIFRKSQIGECQRI